MPGKPARRWGNPGSMEGQAWLGQFNRHFIAWLAEHGNGGDELLLKAAAALGNMLSRSPADAATVQGVALSAAFNARLRAGPEPFSALARVGHDADLLLEGGGDTERSSARALLNLYLAEAELRLRRTYSGLEALRHAEDLMLQAAPAAPLTAWLEGYARYLRGALRELGADFAEAARAYGEADEKLGPLVLSDERLAKTSIALLDLVLGGNRPPDRKQAEQVFLLAANQVRAIAALNAFCRMRASWIGSPGKNLGPLARDTWRIAHRTGMPDAQTPVDVFPLVLALPEEEAREVVVELADKIGGVRGDAPDWRAVLCSARLAHQAPAAAWWRKELERALPEIADPLADAFVQSRLLLAKAAASRPGAGEIAAFFGKLRRLAQRDPVTLEQPRVRALFDEPIALCIDAACRELGRKPGSDGRVRLAVLLDALRGEKLGALAILADGPPAPDTLEASLLPAFDRLQRIAHALRSHRDAIAIVLQRHAGGFAFLCVTGDAAKPIQVIEGGAQCEAACRQLTGHLAKRIQASQVSGDAPNGSGVEPAGRAAFRALPKALRKLMGGTNTLLIVPDYRSGLDTLPFELLHDGKQFLGAGRVIARFSSLRSLTRAVERLSRRPPERIALVVAASRAAGQDPLPRARDEAEAIRSAMEETGWDAPKITQRRLSQEFFVERLEHASMLHLSAHGEVGESDGSDLGEAVILPGGQRFTTDELLRKTYPRLPLAYINCCWLGKSRYLGGGISRGIAHTLVEMGGPAAIANLLPVDDEAATTLALEFYAQFRRHPIGEALRRARQKLAERGRNPILWGSAVLIGDPWATLEPGAPERTSSEKLLDEYFSLSPDPKRREAARLEASVTLIAEPGDTRLQAAVELLRWAAVPDLATSEQRELWSRVIRLADELDHPPASAFARAVLVLRPAPGATPAETLRLADDALRHLKAMTALDKAWERLLIEVQIAKDRAETQRKHELWGAEPEDFEVDPLLMEGDIHDEFRPSR